MYIVVFVVFLTCVGDFFSVGNFFLAARLGRKYSVVTTIANSYDYDFCLSLGNFLFEKKRDLKKHSKMI